MSIPVADLHPIRDLYNAGQYRQALAAGERFGPLGSFSHAFLRKL